MAGNDLGGVHQRCERNGTAVALAGNVHNAFLKKQTPGNGLLDEMTTLMLAEFDTETRFNARAARGAGMVSTGPMPIR